MSTPSQHPKTTNIVRLNPSAPPTSSSTGKDNSGVEGVREKILCFSVYGVTVEIFETNNVFNEMKSFLEIKQ